MGVNKRVRPVTYAEALEAKESLKNNEIIEDKIPLSEYNEDKSIIQKIIKDGPQKISKSPLKNRGTSMSHLEVSNLPSGGKAYPDNSQIYYKPLTFGDVKFLSGSKLSDIEAIDFFMEHIECSFDKNLLTYFDFYFLVVLIKASTFGDGSYSITFNCSKCNHIIKEEFEIGDLDFIDLQIPLPAKIKRSDKFIDTYKSNITDDYVEFSPLTILSYKTLLTNGLNEDYDAFMAAQITNFNFDDALKIIKDEMIGPDVNLLESLEEMFYHGVNDLKIVCKNKINENSDKENLGNITEEVCGEVHNIPFQSLTKYISSTDSVKASIRNRISFGV